MYVCVASHKQIMCVCVCVASPARFPMGKGRVCARVCVSVCLSVCVWRRPPDFPLVKHACVCVSGVARQISIVGAANTHWERQELLASHPSEGDMQFSMVPWPLPPGGWRPPPRRVGRQPPGGWRPTLPEDGGPPSRSCDQNS